MLNIFILEDDPIQLDQIAHTTELICSELNLKCQCHSFQSPAGLEGLLPQPSVNNIFIIDLELNGIQKAGLEFSKKVRAHDQLCSLIFITVHDEFLYHTYKYRVSALDFIAKDYDNIKNELYKDIKQITVKMKSHNNDQPFTYKDYSSTINIDFMNINYFESNSTNSHSAILNTVDNQQRQINYNLHKIEKIDSRLMRVHRSYLVNPKQIKYVDSRKKIVHFYNGALCPVSKLHLHTLLKTIN